LEIPKSKQLGRYGQPKNMGKAPKTSEAMLQKQCEDYLVIRKIAFVRIPDAVYREVFGRNNTSPRLRGVISSYLKGLPDLTVLYPSGRYLAIELKSGSGKMTQGQKNFKKLVGVDNYYLVRSFDAFRELVDENL